ncbi:PREDICTED: pollen-specific leucine-rich repeat extensin-like protein 3, partial [Papilio polytes]|uniref:pollen-specific leucine-rich repeat extensin-like protein 3 n=1 Tax=Papilio polytes TaxID=76194 RepID=UPI000675D5DC
PPIEVSASQQDFFKMLDEKIEKGKDYDSSSETEVKLEQERRRILIEKWRSASQSTQSSQSQPSPPTPARRRVPRPMPQPPERQNSPGAVRRCYRQQHVPEGMSPPPRRAHSAQSHHPPDSRPINGDNWHDPTKSPVKRPQSAGSNWKSNPKVAPYNQKTKKTETNEHQRANQKEIECEISAEASQITYNPTFQSHSPAHSAKGQQPYIAQIVSYPKSQQVNPPSPPKFIAPPEEYQDPQNTVDNKYNNVQKSAPTTQPNNQFPNVEYTQTPRMYEGEEFSMQYGHPAMRPHSAPTPVGVVRPMPVAPSFKPLPDGTHMVQMPMWTHMPPVVSTMPWVPGQVPHEMQYYPQSQYFPMYRPHSAGSAGTLTRYHKKESSEGDVKNVCQSINVVRQKVVGQIVSVAGQGQELTVCSSASDSPSPASVSTDSGVSPGNSAPSSKTSFGSDTATDKSKKKSMPLNARSLKNSKSLDN